MLYISHKITILLKIYYFQTTSGSLYIVTTDYILTISITVALLAASSQVEVTIIAFITCSPSYIISARTLSNHFTRNTFRL